MVAASAGRGRRKRWWWGWIGSSPTRSFIEAQQALLSGCEFIATNRDNTYPIEGSIIPGGGSIVAAVAAAAEREPITMGKPSEWSGELIARHARSTSRDEALMVGDRLETDIEMGRARGNLDLHGAYRDQQPRRGRSCAGSQPRPHWVIPSIAEVPELLVRPHRGTALPSTGWAGRRRHDIPRAGGAHHRRVGLGWRRRNRMDLKVFAALGVFGACAVTALTAQNTVRVLGAWQAPSDFVRAQIAAVRATCPWRRRRPACSRPEEIVRAVAAGTAAALRPPSRGRPGSGGQRRLAPSDRRGAGRVEARTAAPRHRLLPPTSRKRRRLPE